MTIQNMKGCCEQINKEIKRTGAGQVTEEQLVHFVEFVKPKKWKNEDIIQALMEFEYIRHENDKWALTGTR